MDKSKGKVMLEVSLDARGTVIMNLFHKGVL
jgi:hypothetical protein